jgi:hypothetical protein
LGNGIFRSEFKKKGFLHGDPDLIFLHTVDCRDPDIIMEMICAGELGSGKTSIIKRYVHQFFSQHYRATIGVDFALKVSSD